MAKYLLLFKLRIEITDNDRWESGVREHTEQHTVDCPPEELSAKIESQRRRIELHHRSGIESNFPGVPFTLDASIQQVLPL